MPIVTDYRHMIYLNSCQSAISVRVPPILSGTVCWIFLLMRFVFSHTFYPWQDTHLSNNKNQAVDDTLLQLKTVKNPIDLISNQVQLYTNQGIEDIFLNLACHGSPDELLFNTKNSFPENPTFARNFKL